MNKAIFLDRDGTINVEKNYLYKIEDFEFLPGVIDALKLLQDAGFILIIVTNQSGIGRGYYTEKEFDKLNTWMIQKLEVLGIKIRKVYFCPHLPDATIAKYRKNCSCRKPKLGMFEDAIKEFDIDVSLSYTIGDKIRDCAICETTNCKGFLIADNERKDILQKVKNKQIERIQYAQNLLEASKIIVKH